MFTHFPSIKTIAKLIQIGLQVLAIKSMESAADKGFCVGNFLVEPIQMVRVFFHIKFHGKMIEAFLFQCIIGTIGIAADYRIWTDGSFSKFNERNALYIRNNLHFQILWVTTFVKRKPDKNGCLIGSSTTLFSFGFTAEERIIKLYKARLLVLCIPLTHRIADLMQH